eukprot:1508001-Amphidinium_carterae.1
MAISRITTVSTWDATPLGICMSCMHTNSHARNEDGVLLQRIQQDCAQLERPSQLTEVQTLAIAPPATNTCVMISNTARIGASKGMKSLCYGVPTSATTSGKMVCNASTHSMSSACDTLSSSDVPDSASASRVQELQALPT